MARSITVSRPIAGPDLSVRPVKPNPWTAPEDLVFFKPAKGVNTVTRLSETPRESGPTLSNVIIQRGHYLSRPGTEKAGPSAADPLMYAFDLRVEQGTYIPVRFTTRRFQVFDGSTWNDVPGALLTGSPLNYIAVTMFGNKLLFSNGVDGLFEYDPTTGSLTQITTSVKVPSAMHLTMFNNRVIASNVVDDTGSHPTRIRWSEKNDETKWDETVDIGAGFEDVINAPGYEVDTVHGVFPITDQLAMVVRSHSVWLMSVTGQVDAPFQFSLLFDNIGSDAPLSLARIPGAVIGLFTDNFYMVSQSQPVPFGTEMIDDVIGKIISLGQVFGAYDPYRQEYRVIIKEDGAVWRYSFRDKGWTRDVYPFTVKSLSTARHPEGSLTINQLQGTINQLQGTINELGVTGIVRGMHLVQAGSGGQYVLHENPGSAQDVNASGTLVDSALELRTGLILPVMPIEKVEVEELQLEYEAMLAQVLTFEWSSDGGATWNTYSSNVPVVATSGPDVLSVRKTVSAKKMQIRVTSPTLGGLRVIALHVFATRGALQKP